MIGSSPFRRRNACFLLLLLTGLHATTAELEQSCGMRPSHHAFVFYAKSPSIDVLNFAVELSENTPFGVYVVPDDEKFVWADASKHPNVHLRIVPKSDVIAAQLTHSSNFDFSYNVPAEEAIWAHDRALTLASSEEFSEKYCRVWLIEDDVFIPSVAAAVSVDVRARGDPDFISTPIMRTVEERPTWVIWSQFRESMHRYPVPESEWKQCMMNAVGMSTRFLAKLRSFAQENGQLMFAEPMWPTFVTIWGMEHLRLDELHMLWRNKGKTDYNWREISRHPLWWYHPMKNVEKRLSYRERVKVADSKIESRKSKKKLKHVSR